MFFKRKDSVDPTLTVTSTVESPIVPATASTTPADAQFKIFTPRQTLAAAALGGPFAGCWLISRNFFAFGETKKASDAKWIGIGTTAAALAAVVCLQHYGATDFTKYVTMVCAGGAHGWCKANQGPRITQELAEGRPKGSNWKVVLIGIIGALVTLTVAAPVFAITYLVVPGNAEALIGKMYYNGYIVQKNPAEGIEWMKKSAAKENGYGELLLGIVYGDGKEIPQDKDESQKWFRKSADHGEPTSQLMLGVMYMLGDGVPQNFDAAETWFLAAGKQGQAEALDQLALFHEKGINHKKDTEEAYFWESLAAEEDSKYKDHRNELAAPLSKEQLAYTRQRIANWKKEQKKTR